MGRSRGCGGGCANGDPARDVGRLGVGATTVLSDVEGFMSPEEEAVIIADWCGSLSDTVEAAGVLNGS